MSASEKELIRVEDLHKSFGSLQVLKGVTEHVDHGEVVSVIGPSGGGKSTFLRCLNLLETPTSGKIYFEGTDITDKNVDINLHRQKMGMVFQHFNVFNNLTVGKNVTLAPVLLGKKTQKEADEMMRELLNRVGLADKENQFPKKLSGGLLRRLNIACGIAHKPRLIILDEPTVAVDPQSRNKILEGIQELNRQGSTIIYTSHYMEEVEQICTRIAIMDHGRVIASGTTEELKKMIKTGETITVEALLLTEKQLQDIRNLPHVFDVHYEDQILTLRCTGAQHNLIRILNYLQSQSLTFGRVFSELPTLNDVFLEITGKQLRD